MQDSSEAADPENENQADDQQAEAALSSSSRAGAPDPDHNPAQVGMKQSQLQLERTKLSKKFKNTMQMCLWWLADRCKRATAVMMSKVAYPLYVAHAELLVFNDSVCLSPVQVCIVFCTK